MKLLSVLVVLAFVLSLAPARAAEPGDAVKEQVVRFYKFYMHALNAEGDPLTKNRDTMKRYVSERFLKEVDRLSKIEGGIEADPFICAQDFDDGWEKNISVKDIAVTGKTATAKVELSGKQMDPHHLNLKLVEAADGWKIDRISDADLH